MLLIQRKTHFSVKKNSVTLNAEGGFFGHRTIWMLDECGEFKAQTMSEIKGTVAFFSSF